MVSDNQFDRQFDKRSPRFPEPLRNDASPRHPLQPQHLLHAHGAGDGRSGGRLLREAQRDLHLLQPHPRVSSVAVQGCPALALIASCRRVPSIVLPLTGQSSLCTFCVFTPIVSEDMFA